MITFNKRVKEIHSQMHSNPLPDDPVRWQLIVGPHTIRNKDGVLKALVQRTAFPTFRVAKRIVVNKVR